MSGGHRRCLQTRAEGLWLAWEVYMTKHPSERPSRTERIPRVPPPSAASARDGAELAREEARRYLPDAVRLLAGIALAPDSEAALHTRMLCAKQIVEIAGVIPQTTPSPPLPPYERPVDGRELD
jgi:hypothetical protein